MKNSSYYSVMAGIRTCDISHSIPLVTSPTLYPRGHRIIHIIYYILKSDVYFDSLNDILINQLM